MKSALLFTFLLAIAIPSFSQSKPKPPKGEYECPAPNAVSLTSGAVIDGSGYRIYKPVKQADGKCKDVEDKEGEQKMYQWQVNENKKREDLVWAARSRLLTADEMKQLQEYGPGIFVPVCIGVCGGYDPMEDEKRFNELVMQQFRLQVIARDSHAASNPNLSDKSNGEYLGTN